MEILERVDVMKVIFRHLLLIKDYYAIEELINYYSLGDVFSDDTIILISNYECEYFKDLICQGEGFFDSYDEYLGFLQELIASDIEGIF